MAGEPSYQFIRTRREEAVGIVQLNRPDVLNALSTAVIDELIAALQAFDADESIRCLILTGNERAFAAGADIKEMAGASTVDMLLRDNLARWERIRAIKKPIIAAVSGFALGGGNELAMNCDMIIASDTADVRPAGDQHRRDAGRGRHPTPHPRHRQGPRHGDDPDRAAP